MSNGNQDKKKKSSIPSKLVPDEGSKPLLPGNMYTPPTSQEDVLTEDLPQGVLPSTFIPDTPEEAYGESYDLAVRKYEQKVREQVRENYEYTTGEKFVTDDEKTNRIDEIDATIEKLKEEQSNIAERAPGDNQYKQFDPVTLAVKMVEDKLRKRKNIGYITDKIVKLDKEKKELKEKLQPVTKKELANVGDNYGLGNGLHDAAVITEYGKDRAQKIYNKVINGKLDEVAQIKLKTPDPETILSYDNLIHGKERAKEYPERKSDGRLWKSITETSEYGRAMYDEKRKLLYDGIKKSFADKEGIENKDKTAQQILGRMIDRFARSNDGNLTMEGYKMFAEYQIDRINSVLEWTRDALGPIGSTDAIKFSKQAQRYTDNLIEKHGSENFSQWYKTLTNDALTLGKAKEQMERILELPEAKNGIRDVGKAFKSIRVEEFMLGLPEMMEALDITRIVKKAESGETLTYGEEIAMTTYATTSFASSFDTEGRWYKATRGALVMAPYVAEFLITTPIFDIAAKGTTKLVAPLTRKYLGKFGPRVADLTAKNISRVSGAAFQSLAMPQMYVKYAAENVRSDVLFNQDMDSISYTLLENTGDSFIKGLGKGYLSTFGEMAFERSGRYLMQIAPTAIKLGTRAGRKLTGKQFIEGKLIDNWMKLKKITSVTTASEYMVRHKLGWDGLMGEYLEELGTYFWENKLHGRSLKGDNFWDDQLTTLMTVSMFGMAMNIPTVTRSYIMGNDVIFQVHDREKDEDRKISIPMNIWKEFDQEVLSKGVGYFDADKFTLLLDKHKDNLSKEQFELLFSVTKDVGQRRMVDLMKTLGPGKKKKEEPVPGYDPTFFGTEEDAPVDLTPAEKKIVNTANKKIIKENPDLARLGLLIKEPATGQYIEPSKIVLQQLQKQVRLDWAEKAEFNKLGDLTNVTPELELLEEQKDVLEEKLEGMHALDKDFKDLTTPEQHERLLIKLKKGEKITGTSSKINARKISVETKDGEKVQIFLDPNLDKNDREKVNKAILEDEEIKLKLQPYEEWNIDKEGKPIWHDPSGIPYFDRIQAFIGNTPIGNVQIYDYAEEAKIEKDLETKETLARANMQTSAAAFFETLVDKFGGINRVISDERRDELGKEFVKMVVDVADWTDVKVEQIMQRIMDWIRNLDLSAEEKGFLAALAEKNEAKIKKAVTEKQLKEKGFKKRVKDITLQSLDMPEIDSPFPTGSIKVDAFLNGYAPIWKTIAEELGTSKSLVEKRMFQLAQQKDILGYLQNEAIFSDFLNTLLGTDRVVDAIVDVLKRSTLSSAVSLFDFYHNIYLAKQMGILIQKGNLIVERLLNPSERYDEFIDKFWNNIETYELKDGSKGYEAVMRRIKSHTEERDNLFKTEGNRNWAWYDSQTSEKRETLRRTQHERDINLLTELSGLSSKLWNQYFTKQTKETLAKDSRDAKTLTEYGTYDNLLKHDTWRTNYRRIQSNIAFNLSLSITVQEPGEPRRTRTPEEFRFAFNAFFMQGSENKGTLSNLYKLSTAITDVNDIGSSGIDIKTNRFNSFIQSSNVSDLAHNILTSNLDNHIVDFYRERNKEMELIFINGLHHLELNRDQKGTDNVNLSNEDMWITQLFYFLEEGDSYLHWTGQFGDKPQMMVVRAPKITEPTKKQYDELRKDFPDFNKTVNWFIKEYLEQKQEFFSSLFQNLSYTDRKVTRQKLAGAFLYNFAKNIKATNELFFGKEEQYTDLTDMVKRAGSSNSPGYRLNPFVEGGVGESFRFAMINDDIEGIELLDGMEFMSGEYAERSQVSMGSGLSKVNLPGYEILSSMKALTSFIDEETGLRGLTKGNRINIELLANDFPDSKFADIRDFMAANKIDILSPTSTTKKHEKVIKKSEVAIELWNKDGSVKKKIAIPEFGIIDRKTKDVYVQQDLRHSNEAKATKMPSQLLANVLILESGPELSAMIYQLQSTIAIDMMKEFENKSPAEVKLKWLKENVNEHTQPELFKLLEAGVTVYEPAMANYMRSMLASALTRKALEVPINRLTTQEIADPGKTLDGRKSYKDKSGIEHILLPDIAANVSGARYENIEYKGKSEEAKIFILANKELHRDLFDAAGNYIEWIVEGRNGIIPGEYIISTRVPASGLHSHTVGRLKNKISTGNFTMIDVESRLISGADMDGDQRFNQVFFRSKTGRIILDNSKEGIANKIMMAIANDYTNSEFNERIQAAIEVNKYDDIVDLYRDKKVYNFVDARGYDKARNENIVGVKLKGILTDITTIYSIIASRDIKFRFPVMISISEKKTIKLTGFARDPIGLLKTHLANFLNMAFDNAADPKLEIMGINEHTVNMFVLALLGNKELDPSSDKSIMNHIGQIVKYFTSPLLRSFTNMMRRDSGGLRKMDLKELERRLARDFSQPEARKVLAFYNGSREMIKLRKFYKLTQKASASIIDLISDKTLYDSIRNNDRKAFSLIDVKPLFNEEGSPVTEFAMAEEALGLTEMYIFADTFYFSQTGQQIMNAVLKLFPGRESLTINELKSLNYGLTNLVAIKVLGVKQGAESIEKELIENLDAYRQKYPGNDFLKYIHKVVRDGKYHIEIAPDNKQAKIGDEKLLKIRNDFDLLYKINPDLAKKFVALTVHKWGATTSTFKGAYYSLLGNKFRVDYSILMQNELVAWQLDEISSVEKLQIMEWILRQSNIKKLNLKAFISTPAPYYDYHSMATLDTPVTYEALDDLTGITTAQEFKEFTEQYQFDKIALAQAMADVYKKEMASMQKDVLPAVVKFLEDFRETALRIFPPATDLTARAKDMLPEDSIGEALATKDEALQQFVYARLNKMYPGVAFFTNREEFFVFVKKWGGYGYNVSPHAIGHAFKNAVFIDPEKAVQSAMFHEHAHIYWDALPKNHIVKKELLALYKKEFSEAVLDDLEELIILDIGRSSVDFADIKLRGSAFSKFRQYLKQFWRAVKSLFGIYSKTDLIDQLTYDIWYNSDNIVPVTNRGNAIVQSMISYNFAEDEIPGFHGETHTHTIGGIPVPSVTGTIQIQMSEAFNPEIKAHAKVLKDGLLYRGLTREVWSDEEKREMTVNLLKFWDEGASEKGTSIHKVGEAVFNDWSLTDDFINDNFASRDVYVKLKKLFQEIREDILLQYPDATFYTEPHLISKKYKIGGFSDLVVDTGNKDLDGKRELIVYEFKTTAEDYADSDMSPLSEYKRAFNMFKAPFQNLTHSKYTKHTIQLNMYANMLEEQTNPKNPGEKNKIVRLRVIPIKREIDDKTKKVTNVEESNWVKIPRNKKSTDVAEKMMQQGYMQRQNVGEIYPEYKDNLLKARLPGVLINDMLKAMHFMNLYTGNIKKINKTHIDDIRNEGINTQFAKLIAPTVTGGLGYKMKDFQGPEALTSEELFFISYENIKRDDYIGYLDEKTNEWIKGVKEKYYHEQEVGASYVAKPNPKRSNRKWHRYGDKILEDVGYRTVEKGDELMMVYSLPKPPGTPKQDDIYFYEVLEVNRRRRRVKILNQETGLEDFLKIPGERDGLTKLHEKLPAGIKDPGPESYIPAYLHKKEEIKEKHWKLGADINIAQFESTEEGELRRNMRAKQMRRIWRFFEDRKTWADVTEFYEDADKTYDFYQELILFDNAVAESISLLTREEATNHWMAEAIRRENESYSIVPEGMLPMTLNAYYILTNHKDMVWKDFDRALGVRSNMVPRMMELKYVPTNMFTSDMQTVRRLYTQKSFELNQVMKQFAGKIDYHTAAARSGGRLYWNKPGELQPGIERDFLEALYSYYRTYDTAHKERLEQGRESRIEVSKIFASADEFVREYGSRFGSKMRKKLKPAEYDSVPLKVVTGFNKEGKPEYQTDKNDKIIVRTLGQIKEQFALKTFKPHELLDYFGSKWKRMFFRIPGIQKVFGKSSAGILDYQIRKAINIYDKGAGGIALTEQINKQKKRIPIVGRGDTKYATELLVEAEAKAIDSMIFAYYHKRLMAPLDWMIHMYSGADKNNIDNNAKEITKWLRTWGEYQLYGIKPDQAIMGSREWESAIHFALRANSLNKIAFSLVTQVNNFAIGQTLNLVREPRAYAKGLGRLFKDGKVHKNLWKARRILQRYGLATIVDEFVFDQIDKELKILGVDITAVENVGYSFMDITEKLNQFPIFAGLMTDEEWNAYDDNGKIIDEKANKHMSEYKAQLVATRTQDIHGDYSTINASPWMLHNFGRAVWQFKKWLPAMVWSHFAPYHIDRNMTVRSGLFPTFDLLTRIVRYNVTAVAERQEKRERIIRKAIEEDKFDSNTFFGTTQDYFHELVKEANGRRIKYKDLSPSDRRNATSLVLELMIAITNRVISLTLLGGDDDEYKSFGLRMFTNLFNRFQGDVFYVYKFENWEYLTENMVPLTSLLIESGKFIVDFQYWLRSLWDPNMKSKANYQRDTFYSKQGMPKFTVDATYVMPAGSFLRWSQKRRRIWIKKHNILDLHELGLSEKIIRIIDAEGDKMSQFDIEELSMEYGKYYKIMMNNAKYEALRNKGIDPSIYLDAEIGENLLKREMNKLEEAMKMHARKQQIDEGEGVEDEKAMFENAKAWEKMSDAKKSTTKKRQKRKYEEALEELK